MIRALPWKLNKHYKKFYFIFQKMGYNCSHEQFLQWTKNESGGAGGGSVYDVCWHSVDFPLDCHSMRTKKVTLLIIPRASLCYLTHSPSCRYPLSIDFPSSVVNLSESCPIHLWQWLCLWYKQSIWLSQTVWNLAAFFFSQFHFMVDLLYVYPIPLPRRHWPLKMVTWKAKWLPCWVRRCVSEGLF